MNHFCSLGFGPSLVTDDHLYNSGLGPSVISPGASIQPGPNRWVLGIQP